MRHIPNFWPGVLTGFSLGVAILTLPAGYPPWRWEVALVWSLIAACGVGFLRRYGAASTGCRTLLCLFLAGLAGYLYGAGRVAAVLNHQLPDCADETSRTFSFRIIDAPAWQHDELTGRNNARFVALVDGGWGDEACPVREDRLLRLGWYDAPPNLAAGQRWRGRGKLRPPWGYRNPGGFDYERWLLGRGLHGTGYLASGTLLEPGDSSSLLTDLRNALQAWLATQSLQQPALVRALMLGDDAAVSQDEWKLLRSSGTIHLLVVSGLHVGMVAGMTFLLARWALRPFPGLLLWCGAKRLASVFAIAGSGLYVLLSGSGVPALRAWLMSTAALLCVGLGRAVAPQRMMILIVFLMLAGNPLVVHQQGFWLSFAAVAALLWFYLPRLDGGQGTRQPGLARLGRWALSFLQAQLVLLVALAPLLALTQGEVPLHGPLINSLAVPLIAVLVLPLLLVAAALATWLPGPAGGLLSVADELLALLMQIIRTAASWPALPVSVAGPVELGLALLGVLVLSLAIRPGRAWLLMGLWVVLLLPDGGSPAWGEFRVTALDVGQGSAILIETRHHTLIYDTGPGYPSGFNLGETVVIPSVFKSRLTRPDVLIISHDDSDHSGGAAAVIERLRPREIMASFDAGQAGQESRSCEAGTGWMWEGVRFSFLHPRPGTTGQDNDRSCVLLVEAGLVRALLAGDISARIERRLPNADVQLLFAPHHGSATSSSMSLIRRMSPVLVFISSPRRSRYGHPHPEVLARYREAGARVHVTGREGALVWESGTPGRVVSWRRDRGAYWHGRN